MRALRGFLVAIAAAAVGGCGLNFDPQPNPTQFYLMSAIPDSPPAPADEPLRDSSLGIGPFGFAPYLDQQKIVTRVEANRVEFGEFERWAEPFSDHFLRVLGQILHNRLGPRELYAYPWIGTRHVDYQVECFIWRFDRTPDGGAEIEVDWILRDGVTGVVLASRDVYMTEPANGTGVNGAATTDDTVAAMSRATGRLGEEIARAIREVRAGR
jgi:uncharacterized lipoprotein YmbA